VKIVRYFAVGAVAASVDFLLFALFVKQFDVHWFGAAIGSFVIATAVNYLLSIRHVFQSGVRFGRRHEIAYVFLISGVGLAINQLALYLFIELQGIDELVAKLFATAAAFMWNYLMRRYFVFAESRKVAS
jgi:putative flippase GtrA